MSHYLLHYTYHFYIASLGHTGDPNQFWLWKGNCAVCQKPKQGLKELFCANFCHSQGKFPPCKKVWCGECYQKHTSDRFEVQEELDEDGYKVMDDDSKLPRYSYGVDGAHLMTTFQCDLCIFRKLQKRNPVVTSKKDELLLGVVRRINLDAFWARARRTGLR